MLDQFIDFLSQNEFKQFHSNLSLTKSAINFLKSTNPRLVVEQFIEIVGPYKNNIFDCNESFFLNFESSINLSSDNILIGMNLRDIWKSNITNEQKAHIWYYFQQF